MRTFQYEDTWGQMETVDLSIEERRTECEETLRLIREELTNLPESHIEAIFLAFKLEDDELITIKGAGKVMPLLTTFLQSMLDAVQR